MSKFKVGDRVRLHGGKFGTVTGPEAYGLIGVRRDDGQQGNGTNGVWCANADYLTLERNPILDIPDQMATVECDFPMDSKQLRAIYINAAGVRRAIESGLFPEDQIEECLIGMVDAYCDILEDRFPDEEDAIQASAIGWVNDAHEHERETQRRTSPAARLCDKCH